jgi:hypothetical protein
MSRSFNHSNSADFKALVDNAARRRSARKLALLAWGDAAIADQVAVHSAAERARPRLTRS